MRINRADLLWIQRFIDNYSHIIEAYPELVSEEEEDDLKVVKQLVKEKLDE